MTEKVCRDRVPLTLCHDRVICVTTGHISQAHDWVYAWATRLSTQLGHARDNIGCTSDRNPRPHVETG